MRKSLEIPRPSTTGTTLYVSESLFLPDKQSPYGQLSDVREVIAAADMTFDVAR